MSKRQRRSRTHDTLIHAGCLDYEMMPGELADRENLLAMRPLLTSAMRRAVLVETFVQVMDRDPAQPVSPGLAAVPPAPAGLAGTVSAMKRDMVKLLRLYHGYPADEA